MQCITPYRKKDPRKGMIDFPCGNCFACRINKVRDWTTRLLIEAQGSVYSYFVTITYDDLNVPLKFVADPDGFLEQVVMTLDKDHIQKFHKRLRRAGYVFRYYLIGEYGTHTFRPHYHAIYFSQKPLSPDQLMFIWGKGNVRFDAVNAASIGYVCRYHLGSDNKISAAVQKPFSLMSRRPGLGYGYLFDNEVREWHKSDLDNRQYMIIDGKKRYLPSYLKKKMYHSFGLQMHANKLRLQNEQKDRQLIEEGLYEKKLKKIHNYVISKELERKLNTKNKL